MACVDENAAVALLEARLSADEAAELLAHAAQCDTCRELVAELAKDTTGSEIDDHDLATVDPNRYAVGRVIARGGMGRITAARDRRLGRPVAIKELLIESHELRARFEREVRITAKLQHPAIVNLIEAGTWPGGEPFYVMKLVAGESLDKVIAQRSTLEARLGLLPNVIAAVDALAYAHSMRVVHRDLKPANVLVGEFGETVVIDWGVAKDLADTSGEPDVAVGPFRTPAALGQTAAGSIIGTPAYMPPEQAAGGSVDERADVYALGAMLYHVLAGAPPYAGKPEEILEAVVAGSPTSLEARTPGLPPDLVAIVTKAMARATADRYPTARELNDDLKKFQTGRLVEAHHYSIGELVRRWVKRHRAAVGVAGAAALVLIVGGVIAIRSILRAEHAAQDQRTVAETQRELTRESRGQAESLLGFMVTDLQNKLAPLGRLDVLDDVAKRATAYYARRGEDLSDDELATRSTAMNNLGDVLLSRGDVKGALAQHRQALAIADKLVAKNPANADWQRTVWLSHKFIGVCLDTLGDLKGALAEYRQCLTLATAHDWSRELSASHSMVADALRASGDVSGALVEHRAGLAVSETAALQAPSDSTLQQDLAIHHDKVGGVLFAKRDVSGAIAEFEASLAIEEKLAAKEPTNADWQRGLVIGHTKIGDALSARGDDARALEEYRASLARAETLAANDPTNSDRQLDLSACHGRVSDALRALKDADGALAQVRAQLAIAEKLVAREPANVGWQRNLSVTHNTLGTILRDRGDGKGAVVELRASLAITAAQAAKDPTNADLQQDLSYSHVWVGKALLAQRDATGALDEFRAALAIGETLAAKDPTNVDRQQDVAVRHEQIGDALLARNDAAGSAAEYKLGLAIAQRLQDKDPKNAGVRELATKLAAKAKK